MALKRRRNKTITYNGRTRTLVDWAAELGISPQALGYRIDAGWPLDEVFNRPVTVRCKVLDATELRAIKREFKALIVKMDRALGQFNERLNSLADNSPGVGQKPLENLPDQSSRVAQDSV